MVADTCVEECHSPEGDEGEGVAVQRRVRDARNHVVRDRDQHRRQPQTEQVVRVPPVEHRVRQASLQRAGRSAPDVPGAPDDVADRVIDSEPDRAGYEEPDRDVDRADRPQRDGRQDVDDVREPDHEQQDVDRPDELAVLAALAVARQQPDDPEQKHQVPRPRAPHAQPLAPHPTRADETREHVEERAEVHHRQPGEDDAAHVRGPIRLKLSHEMPPNASGVTNSVARTRPKRSTTVSQKIAERNQWRAARSGKRRTDARALSGQRSRRLAITVAGPSVALGPPSPRPEHMICHGPKSRGDDRTVIRIVILMSSHGSVMVGAVRILVIEDEPRILGFLARGLESEGFAVDGARNGREGLKRAQRDTYDLVLLDLLLPGIDGLSVLHELNKTAPGAPGRDRVGAVGPADEAARLRPRRRRLPEQAVLFRRADRAHPCAAPAAKQGEDGHLVRAGTLVLDLARREARLGQVTAQLSDREFRVLHHLARASRRGDQPRAPALGGLGLPLRSRARTSSTSAFAGCAKNSVQMRRSKRFAMRAIGLLRRRWPEPPGRLSRSRTSSRWPCGRAGKRFRSISSGSA